MNTIKNVGDRIVVKDPSGEFYVIGEIGHIAMMPPIMQGMEPMYLYYIISYNDAQNVFTDPEVVDFEYYDVLDSENDLIVSDEEMENDIAKQLGYNI